MTAPSESVDIYTHYPLHLDPASKAISLSADELTGSYSPAQVSALQDELGALNALHRALIALEPPNIPPPPLPVNPKRSAQIAKLRDSANTAYRKAAAGGAAAATTAAPGSGNAGNNAAAEAVRLYTFAIEMALGRPGWEPVGLARDELCGLFANRAQAHMAQGNWAEALVDSRASIECKPVANVKAWWRGAKALTEMGRWAEARDFLERGLEVEGKTGDMERELVSLLKLVNDRLGVRS